jgi:hypothetical protein
VDKPEDSTFNTSKVRFRVSLNLRKIGLYRN